jgi:hypothetical protein
MIYVRVKFGPAEDVGLGNFTWPFVGYWEKIRVAWQEAIGPEAATLHWAIFATLVALSVQALFFLLRPRPAERWWRVGVTFAVLMLFLATPVWEGYPGAATRALLPLTLAFNVLIPRGVRWLPLMLAGNLTVTTSVFEFSPPHEFYRVRGDATMRRALSVTPGTGWHGPERHFDHKWRWSSGRAELRLLNTAGQPMRAVLLGRASSVTATRLLRVSEGVKLVWGETVGTEPSQMRFGLVLPPGETVLTFLTDRPGEKVGTDPRSLAFRVDNLEIVVAPTSVSR